MRTALMAGGLLAFALSFDEIIVTYFTIGGQQTLPIWLFNILFRGTPSQLPLVNVVAVVVVILSIIPVYLAHRLTRDEEGVATVRGGAVAEAGAQI
jgi:putative spermidine/putrescine transport system permease protein